jgi:hypothetical protein
MARFCADGSRFLVKRQTDGKTWLRADDGNAGPVGPWVEDKALHHRGKFSPDGRWALSSPVGGNRLCVLDLLLGAVVPLERVDGGLDVRDECLTSRRLFGVDPNRRAVHA